MRNLSDTHALAQSILAALIAGKHVEIAASRGVIRLVRDGERFKYSQAGSTSYFNLSELETLRRYGYLTAGAVSIGQ